jgi:exonuclease SbcD
MSLRVLHTADWHLGHVLHDVSRTLEHQRFLDWLTEQLHAHQVDALLVAGDVFDNGNPSAEAQQQWYRFLASARACRPQLQVVVTAGNHDSALRLEAPAGLMRALGVFVTGTVRPHLPRESAEALVLPLSGPDGTVEAWVAAVPFLRTQDLPRVEQQEGVDPLVEGMRRAYAQVLELARERRAPHQALLAMGHLYLTGTRLSELSERKIQGGNQHALPVSLFPDDVTYVALGHLHLAQAVGHEHVRYSGSPIPLSLAERTYRHQVQLIDFDAGRLVAQRALDVPRSVALLRVPEVGAAPLPQVLEALKALPRADDEGAPPAFLEVQVQADGPLPKLRAELEAAVKGRHVRLVRFGTTFTARGTSLAQAHPHRDLGELTPEQVLRAKFLADGGAEPSAAVLREFHDALEALTRAEAAR